MAGVTFIDSFVDEFGDTVYVDEDGNYWQLIEGTFLDDITDDGVDYDDSVDDGDHGAINRFE